MSEVSTDLSEDILLPALPEHIVPKRAEFAPWHKVRKQFIREKQWNFHAVNFARRFLNHCLQPLPADWDDSERQENAAEIPEEIRVDRPLNCLVIPGDDILDIRSLWKDSRELNCWIRYLGFNHGQGSDQLETRVHIANNEVTSLQGIGSDSRVLHDAFQSVARTNSQAYAYIRNYGPFHVVNLDLCDSLFPTVSGSLGTYFSALHKLLEYQMHNQTTPWLLFITTEVAPREADPALLHQFCKATRENCNLYAEFAQRLLDLLPDTAFPAASDVVDSSGLSEEELVRLFGVALGKVLLNIAKTSQPQWRVEMLTSYKYTINPQKAVSMLSLAYQFRLVTVPPSDPVGISTAQLKPAGSFDELPLALKIVARVETIRDVDDLLAEDSGLRSQLTQASADLLSSAGYDRDEYLQWVANGEGEN